MRFFSGPFSAILTAVRGFFSPKKALTVEAGEKVTPKLVQTITKANQGIDLGSRRWWQVDVVATIHLGDAMFDLKPGRYLLETQQGPKGQGRILTVDAQGPRERVLSGATLAALPKTGYALFTPKNALTRNFVKVRLLTSPCLVEETIQQRQAQEVRDAEQARVTKDYKLKAEKEAEKEAKESTQSYEEMMAAVDKELQGSGLPTYLESLTFKPTQYFRDLNITDKDRVTLANYLPYLWESAPKLSTDGAWGLVPQGVPAEAAASFQALADAIEEASMNRSANPKVAPATESEPKRPSRAKKKSNLSAEQLLSRKSPKKKITQEMASTEIQNEYVEVGTTPSEEKKQANG